MKVLVYYVLSIIVALCATASYSAQNPNQPPKRSAIETQQEETTQSAKKQRTEGQQAAAESSSAPMQLTSTPEQQAALLHAVTSNDINQVTSYLSQFPQDIFLLYNGITLLMSAIQSNSWDSFLLLLSKTSPNDIDATDPDGSTALMHAADNTNPQYTTLLLNHQANVNHKNQAGETALMHASMKANVPVMKQLIQHGADVHATDLAHQSNALMQFFNAATLKLGEKLKPQQLQSVLLLIESGIDVNQPNSNNDTPLMLAAHYGMYDVVVALVNAGARINAKNNQGLTALKAAHDALEHYTKLPLDQKTEDIKRLISSLKKIITFFDNPYAFGPARQHIAAQEIMDQCRNFPQDVTKIIGQYLTGPQEHHQEAINNFKRVLHETLDGDYSDLQTWIMEHPYELDDRDENGDTPLMLAIKNENMLAVELLANATREYYSWLKSQRTEQINLLNEQLECEEDISKKNILEQQIRELAAQDITMDKERYISEIEKLAQDMNNKELLETLKNALDPQVAPENVSFIAPVLGKLANDLINHIKAGTKNAQEKIENHFASHPEDITAVDKNGNTPLIIAAEFANSVTVELLLEMNADRNARNNAGQTALEKAQESLGLANEEQRRARLTDIITMLTNQEG